MTTLSIGAIMSALSNMAHKSGDPGGFFAALFVEAICAVIISAVVAGIAYLVANSRFVEVFKCTFVIIAFIDLIILAVSSCS